MEPEQTEALVEVAVELVAEVEAQEALGYTHKMALAWAYT